MKKRIPNYIRGGHSVHKSIYDNPEFKDSFPVHYYHIGTLVGIPNAPKIKASCGKFINRHNIILHPSHLPETPNAKICRNCQVSWDKYEREYEEKS